MESYIEIAWIQNFMMNWLSYQLGFAYASTLASNKEKLLLAFISTSISIFSFYKYSIWICLSVEIIILLRFYLRIRAIFLSEWFRFLWIMTFLLFQKGSIHNLAFFPALDASYALWFILILWNIWMIMGESRIRQNHFIIEVQIEGQWLKGYYDSGNLLCINHTPCIFIKTSIYEKCCNSTEFDCQVHTMNHQTIMKGKSTTLMYRSKQQQKVIMIPINQKLPKNCDCLLNMKNQGG